ncbi:DUF58 domain-containing protein [Phyllobacterium sp. CCNWLW109]|uniref:DUF58 domain-containing protein n=1 Tax=Phyllobacterium sp. CCNWLW109 TaxID=3127479 RepID=UPI00307807D6
MNDEGTYIDTTALIMLKHAATNTRQKRNIRTQSMPGPVAIKRRGRGSEIDDIRLWTYGDDIRTIDRNSTARTGVPHVKTFREEREHTTLLLADFRPAMQFGTRRVFMSVAAAEILALSGWRATELGGRVGLLAVGGIEPLLIRAAPSDRGMLAVISGLLKAHAQSLDLRSAKPVLPLDASLRIAAKALPRGGTIVLASNLDDRGDQFEDAVQLVLHRCDLKIACISDAFERSAPVGIFPFETREAVRGVRIVSNQSPVRKKREAMLRQIESLGARVVEFHSEIEPEDQINSLGRLHGRYN